MMADPILSLLGKITRLKALLYCFNFKKSFFKNACNLLINGLLVDQLHNRVPKSSNNNFPTIIIYSRCLSLFGCSRLGVTFGLYLTVLFTRVKQRTKKNPNTIDGKHRMLLPYCSYLLWKRVLHWKLNSKFVESHLNQSSFQHVCLIDVFSDKTFFKLFLHAA